MKTDLEKAQEIIEAYDFTLESIILGKIPHGSGEKVIAEALEEERMAERKRCMAIAKSFMTTTGHDKWTNGNAEGIYEEIEKGNL